MKKKTAYIGLFLSLALILSYLETLIPIHFGIFGVKLGLTNVVVVLMLYLIGAKEAFGISMIRIIMVTFLFGNAFSMIYSFAGGILSFIVMYFLKKTKKFHCVSVSVAGGMMHNIGQLIVAAIVVETYSIFYYIPVLIVAGVITGFLIGVVSQELIFRLEKMIRF